MRKLFIAALIIAAAFSVSLAQDGAASTGTTNDAPNQGRAPKEPNGIGRLDLRVVDESGNPVKGARAKLESNRSDGFFCESWGTTDDRGVIALPPLHMGSLKLKVQAKGYRKYEAAVPTNSLDEPVRVTLARKK
jgi:hypothetical protein